MAPAVVCIFLHIILVNKMNVHIPGSVAVERSRCHISWFVELDQILEDEVTL